MNCEMVAPEVLAKAQQLLSTGRGVDIHEAVVLLLEGKEAYKANTEAAGGKNCSLILNKALKTLHDNPFLALGLDHVEGNDESAVKKQYHKLALRFHPDKSKHTGLLFQCAHSAYNLLTDPEKRAAWEVKRKRQEESLELLRKRREDQSKVQEARRRTEAAGAANGRAGGPSAAGSTGFPPPPQAQAAQSDAEEKERREFNRSFYKAFRQAAKSGRSNGDEARSEPAKDTGPSGDSRPQAPPKPKGLRSTGRTETSVTLEWTPCTGYGSIAYELQWRERGQTEQQWQTAQQLLLNAQCVKKNLQPGILHEFRVRAASAWGWSGYSDAVMVLTAGSAPVTPPHGNDPGARPKSPCEGVRRESQARRDSQTGRRDSTQKTEPSPPWTWQDGHSRIDVWACPVCKRQNVATVDACTTCSARRSYRVDRLNNISGMGSERTETPPQAQSNGRPPGGPPPAEDKRSRRAPPRAASSAHEVETDDEDAWAYTDKDVEHMPAQEVPEEEAAGDNYCHYYEEGYEDEPHEVYRLNTAITKLHNVREEPVRTAKVVGHLVKDEPIYALANAGSWLKVIFHQAYAEDEPPPPSEIPGTGWCLREDKGVEYLLKVDGDHFEPGAAHHGGAFNFDSMGPGNEWTETDNEGDHCWYELRDETGQLYYFNSATGGSQWDPPEWFDETDPETGYTYYRHSGTGVTQWDKPAGFQPVIRAESYTTPEAAFVKSVLSPRRSFRQDGQGQDAPGVV